MHPHPQVMGRAFRCNKTCQRLLVGFWSCSDFAAAAALFGSWCCCIFSLFLCSRCTRCLCTSCSKSSTTRSWSTSQGCLVCSLRSRWSLSIWRCLPTVAQSRPSATTPTLTLRQQVLLLPSFRISGAPVREGRISDVLACCAASADVRLPCVARLHCRGAVHRFGLSIHRNALPPATSAVLRRAFSPSPLFLSPTVSHARE